MSITLSQLLKVVQPEQRPSVGYAKLALGGLISRGEVPSAEIPTILDRYDDQGYTPTLQEIEAWVKQREAAFISELAVDIRRLLPINHDPENPIFKAFLSVQEKYLSKEIDEERLIEEVAETFRWMDSSPLWSGTAADRHWHVAKIQAASLQISARNSATVDNLFDLLLDPIAQQIDWAEQLQRDQALLPSQEYTNEALDRCTKNIESVLKAQAEITFYAVKLGFLFRDAWWIENHAGATLRGYLAQQAAQNAGKGGGKNSSAARLRRIKCFLNAHAEMIGGNPILRSDPPDQNAVRALKLAARKHPDVFKNGSSKRTALEYWEYICSDKVLWAEYENYFKTYG